MFRKPADNPDRELASHDDPVARGYDDWDARVSQAIAGQTAWKRCLYVALGVIAVSVSGNVWQAGQAKVQVIHIVHDQIGNVIGVSVSSDTPGDPTQAMLKAALENWIVNVRSVYVDLNALKRAAWSAAYLVDGHTQADADLRRWYAKQTPWFRAADETAALDKVVAIPPTSATIGPDGLQTWALNWTEVTTSRDGQSETSQLWAGNVTFKVTRPTTPEEANHNPDGIHIVAYSWTGK